MADDSGWSKWARNGRLSAIVWTVTFIAWITFKVKQIPVEGLDTVFIVMSGLLAGNLGITVVKPGESKQSQRDADKAGDTNA